MGHYRSEMGFEAEDEARAAHKAAQDAEYLAALEHSIQTRGIAQTLLTIVNAFEFPHSVMHSGNMMADYRRFKEQKEQKE